MAVLGTAGFMSSAAAATYVEVAGANVNFYYDADFWGDNAATVTGNNISFGLSSDDYTLGASVSKPKGAKTQTSEDSASPAFFVVAHNGYTLAQSLTNGVTGSYALPAVGGQSTISASGDFAGGTFGGGAFSSTGTVGSYSNTVSIASNGAPTSGALIGNVASSAGALTSSALGVDANLLGKAVQTGVGSTYTAYSTVNYGFTVSAVPEPETYGMLIAGLGLLGFMASRRKRAA